MEDSMTSRMASSPSAKATSGSPIFSFVRVISTSCVSCSSKDVTTAAAGERYAKHCGRVC